MTNQDCLRRVFLLYGNLMSNGITMHIGIFGISFEYEKIPLAFFNGYTLDLNTSVEEVGGEMGLLKQKTLVSILQEYGVEEVG